MTLLHPQYAQTLDAIERDIANIEGYLSPRDVHFLALSAAHANPNGEILEIGSCRGKSTVLLAKAAQLSGREKIIAVDPLDGSQANRETLQRNLDRNGVGDRVEFHMTTSQELAKTWNRPISMLWIDGDHRYEAVRADLANFKPFLVDKAIVLIHDVLELWDGCSRAFIEYVLGDMHFGDCGIHGNIGWAQYRTNAAHGTPFALQKRRLAEGLKPVLPFQTARQNDHQLPPLKKLVFRWRRWRAQSKPFSPDEWLRRVA
jgi:predicted O-methyltransferase YrrM